MITAAASVGETATTRTKKTTTTKVKSETNDDETRTIGISTDVTHIYRRITAGLNFDANDRITTPVVIGLVDSFKSHTNYEGS
jgi:hypothetical protein